MSTTAQILANRRNGAHSTGPKSPTVRPRDELEPENESGSGYATAKRSYYKAFRELPSSRQLRNEPKSAAAAPRGSVRNEPNPTGHHPLNTDHCPLRNEPKSAAPARDSVQNEPNPTGHRPLRNEPNYPQPPPARSAA